MLYSPHTSAGRLPTEMGLRLFVNGLLEIGGLTEFERRDIEVRCAATGMNLTQALEQASETLAGLSRHAGLVMAPKAEATLSHIEFVSVGNGRALVILVDNHGTVENRVIDLPLGLPRGDPRAGEPLSPGAADRTQPPGRPLGDLVRARGASGGSRRTLARRRRERARRVVGRWWWRT